MQYLFSLLGLILRLIVFSAKLSLRSSVFLYVMDGNANYNSDSATDLLDHFQFVVLEL